jgi:hypothetical protein
MIDSICIMQLVSPCEWPSLDLCPRKSKGVIIRIFSDFDSSFSLSFHSLRDITAMESV